MSQQQSFTPGATTNRPKVALSLFTMMLGDIMRNLRVEKQPKTIASPRPNNANDSSSSPAANNFSSLTPESNEAVFKAMGVDIGMRTIAHISNVAIVPPAQSSDPNSSVGGGSLQGTVNSVNLNINRVRPTTFLEAAKFVATHCWEYWFDHSPQNKFQHLEAFYIDEYESLSCFPFCSTTGSNGGTGTVNGIQYSMFVQGMIEGAMRACGWAVLVNFSQADEGGLQQYQILPLRLPVMPQAV